MSGGRENGRKDLITKLVNDIRVAKNVKNRKAIE